MDDFNVSALHESKNEWGARLLTILTPLMIEGLKSIFEESVKLCKENNQMDKYLMTFQNLITRIPKWNAAIIENERKRIIERSGCNYLEDLVSCIHIIQLKLLTAMRVGNKQKKIDIDIPKLDTFIHRAYINVARKVYQNVYLFELNIPHLQMQKHNRELEIIIQEAILNTVRETIPVESILRAYMDETVEEDVVEEVKEQLIEPPVKEKTEIIKEGEPVSLKFNDVDMVMDKHGKEEKVEAPKTIERLEEISALRNMQRKLEEQDDDDDEKLNLSGEDVSLDDLDIHVINPPNMKLDNDSLILGDIEVLT
jgi:Family of unknown function (DUF5764)